MAEEHQVPALVLGDGNTALGALRALGRRGIRCHVAPPPTDYVRRSRWLAPWPARSISEAARGERGLVALLETTGLERAVLVPCTDPWVLAIAELSPDVARRFPSSVPSRAALRATVDKGCLAAELNRLGVPYPRTVRLAAAADLRRLPEDGLAGAFLKPADSYAFQKEFGRKAFQFASAGEAESLAAQALAAGLEVMVQEYVPGPPTAHYFLDGFVDRLGRVTAWFARQRLRMWPADFGNSSALVSIPLDEMEAARAGLERFLDAQRYRGIFSAEFKRDPRDGVFRLLEINARAWKFVDFAAACGVDVCHMAYRDALGLPVEPASSYRIGATCIDAYFDRPACSAARRGGELSLLGWARFWAEARPVTFAWDDPGPATAWLIARLFRRAGADR